MITKVAPYLLFSTSLPVHAISPKAYMLFGYTCQLLLDTIKVQNENISEGFHLKTKANNR